MTVWFITGCSTGLGRALATAVLERGDCVVLAVRRPESVTDIVAAHPADRTHVVALEVTDTEACAAAIASAEARFGRVDVLVNNAGFGYRSAVEEAPREDIDRQFGTHFFGPIQLIQSVLPGMRARREGAIVNLSSVGARAVGAGSGYYAASKLALEGASFALRQEVEPLGIRVMIVEPGPFRTDFLGRSLTESPVAIEDYAATAGERRINKQTESGSQQGDPAKAAQLIIDALESTRTPVLLVVGEPAMRAYASAADALRRDIDDWAADSRDTDVED
jgi:NAD(P)-dependent dehydrogenase (short-subunit alcohol dehydrogenase family)